MGSALQQGDATEHTHRPALKILLEALDTGIIATNEPRRQACGAPDYIVTRGHAPVGFIEAKDIGVGLDAVESGEQMKRYLPSLNNLILTDYLEFRRYETDRQIEGATQIRQGTWHSTNLSFTADGFAASHSAST